MYYRSTLKWQHLRWVDTGQGIPCVNCLQPIKKKTTYLQLFRQIKKQVGTPNRLATIITDFEQAVFNACDTVFPDAEHKG